MLVKRLKYLNLIKLDSFSGLENALVREHQCNVLIAFNGVGEQSRECDLFRVAFSQQENASER